VEIHLIIENLGERLNDDKVDELINIVCKVLLKQEDQDEEAPMENGEEPEIEDQQ
jgi:hypothetical protein